MIEEWKDEETAPHEQQAEPHPSGRRSPGVPVRPRKNRLLFLFLLLGVFRGCLDPTELMKVLEKAEVQITLEEGQRLQEEGQYTAAVPVYERAFLMKASALGKHPLFAATSLHALANGYQDQGRYAWAEPLYERALVLREAALGKDHPDVASTLNGLASLYLDQGHYARAEPLYERALAIWEAALGKGHTDVATALNNLAQLYSAQGHYARAEPLLERALAIQQAALGKDHSNVAPILTNLASLYVAQGFYARAAPLLERALGIWEATLGKSHPSVATALNNLASIYKEHGLYERAEPLYDRALTIREVALGKDHPSVAIVLGNLAGLCKLQGRYGRAELLFERALAIQEVALGKDHPDVAIALNNLASIYMDLGLYARAEPLFERALAIQEATLGKDHPAVAQSLYNLARLYDERELYEQAEPFQARALAIWETVLGKTSPQVITGLYSLALKRIAQGRFDEFLPLYMRALSASEEYLRREVQGLSEVHLARLLDELRIEEERLYWIVRARPHDAQVRHLALTLTLLRKCRSVEEVANTSRIIYRSLGPPDREAFERLVALRSQLSTLSLRGPGTVSPALYQQQIKALADQGDSLEADLARRSAPLRALHARPPPSELVDRVAAALPKNGVLIEFVLSHDPPSLPTLNVALAQRSSPLRYLALLLFADGRTHVLDLGPAEPIDRAAFHFHDALARGTASYQEAAQELHARIFRPLEPLLGKAQRLFLSPDGQLALVPFGALHDGRHFLMDVWDITYLTSGKDLLPPPADLPAASSVVVLADPDFNAAPAALSPAGEAVPPLLERASSLDQFFSSSRAEGADQPWPPLPGTRREAQVIRRMLPRAQLLLGGEATKEKLLSLPTPGILHIATHGFFLADPDASPRSRAVGHFGAMGDNGPLQPSADPLLRSGLVLAGAHATSAPNDSQRRAYSLVTALELAGMNLWGTQLVVLSACDTGRGDVRIGQGVFGLRRSLAAAGAQTLVTSLWKINDEATSELMEAYYRKLLSGQGRTSALREAMRDFRRKQPHPHFWAPFIALGVDEPLHGVVPR